jgi:hypothetical protein
MKKRDINNVIKRSLEKTEKLYGKKNNAFKYICLNI